MKKTLNNEQNRINNALINLKFKEIENKDGKKTTRYELLNADKIGVENYNEFKNGLEDLYALICNYVKALNNSVEDIAEYITAVKKQYKRLKLFCGVGNANIEQTTVLLTQCTTTRQVKLNNNNFISVSKIKSLNTFKILVTRLLHTVAYERATVREVNSYIAKTYGNKMQVKQAA